MTRWAAGAAILLVLMSGGGGGRAPLAALAWQLGALALLAGVACAAGALPRAPALAGLAAATCVVLSALQAGRVADSLDQAAAWILAIVPAVALAASPERARERALATASAGLLLVQGLAVAGWPLLGTHGRPAIGQPLGSFFDPNHFAFALVVVTAAHAPSASLRPGGRLSLLLALAAGAVALSVRSRVGWAAILVVIGVEVLRRNGGRLSARVVAALLGALVVLGGFGALALRDRWTESEAWTRPAIWRGAAPAALERPLLGLGPGGFGPESPRFQQPVERGLSRMALVASTPHGEWLRLPIELGAAGLGALVVAAAALAGATPPRSRGRLVVLAAAAGPFLVVHDVFHSPACLAWLAAAAVAGLPSATAAPRTPGLALALALAFAGALTARSQVARHLYERAEPRRPGDLAASLDLAPRRVDALLLAAEWSAPAGLPGMLRAHALSEEAARLAPRDAAAALARARTLASLASRTEGGVAPQAVAEAYAEAVRRAPWEALRAAEAAGVLARGGRPEEALAHARAALRAEPHLARGRAWAVVALRALGRQDEAAAEAGALRADLARAADPGLSPAERGLLTVEPELMRAAGLTDR